MLLPRRTYIRVSITFSRTYRGVYVCVCLYNAVRNTRRDYNCGRYVTPVENINTINNESVTNFYRSSTNSWYVVKYSK